MNKYFQTSRQLFEVFLLLTIAIISNRRAWFCFSTPDPTQYYCENGTSTTDFLWWSIAFLGIVLMIIQTNKMNSFIKSWMANWPLLLFLFYSGVSLIWSQNANNSIHAFYIFLVVSVSASGLVTLYSRETIFNLLLWFSGLTALVSLVVIMIYPQAGISQEPWLADTWRGVFSHKNYFGTVMSFGSGLFLFSFFHRKSHFRVFFLGLYIFSSFLVLMSRSATGLICLIFLSGVTFIYFLWVRYRKHLQPKNYAGLLVFFTLISGMFLLNMESLLLLTGKNNSLTGRVPLWKYLINDVVSLHPWLGYGLETVWYDRGFQVVAGKTAGWGIIVVNSHNGFMDILIYLGALGLGIFMLVVFQSLIRTFQCAIHASQPLDFMPLLILTYVLIANLSVSYFVEFENFHWFLFIISLFMTSQNNSFKDT